MVASALANCQFCWPRICWMTICPSIVSRGPPSSAGVMKNPSERDEDEQAGRRHARHRQLKEHAPERLHARRAHRRGGQRQARVDLVHHRQHGDDRQRQHGVGHAEHHGAAAEQQLGRLRHAEEFRKVTTTPMSAEQHQPDEVLHQRAGPEGKQHEQRKQSLPPLRLARQPVGDRIAQHQAQQRGLERDHEGGRQDPRIDTDTEGARIGRERERRRCRRPRR